MTEDFLHTVSATPFSEQEASFLILQNVQETYIFLDTEMRIVFYNKAAKESSLTYLGWELANGIYFLDLVNAERQPLLKEVCSKVLHGQHQTTEHKFTMPNSRALYIESFFSPAYNGKKEIIGIIVSSKVINEKKKSEKSIKQSEKRLQSALEVARQGAWDWNLKTNEVIYSESYKKLYGFADDELQNDVSEWMNRIHPDDRKKMEEIVAEHLTSHNADLNSQYRIMAGDGQYRWVMAKGTLVSFDEEGKPLRMIGTHTDITEAVEREMELKKINERFDSMMQATQEVLWEWDLQKDELLRPDDGIKNIYNHPQGKPRKIEEWMQQVHPEDQEQIRGILKEVLKAPHQHTFEMEYRLRQKDGVFTFIYDRGILLKDEKGTPIKIIGSAQDISVRKNLEKDILKNELEYQRRLHQATVDSQEKERAEIGKELHDNVNQVLTTTKLYLDLALTNEELKEELIGKSLGNINNVIQEIRLLSRSLMDPSIGDLGLLDSINDLVENIHLTQKVKIRFKGDESVEHCLTDNQKLTVFRIIQEAFSNTLRHAKATEMEITLAIHENNLTLTIDDNGIGFEPGKIKKGAGLKNIQNRIYLNNGTLQLESNSQQGCCFKIQFPIKNVR